jgi:DNA-binding transcriptional regulator GbsR (MarR family)
LNAQDRQTWETFVDLAGRSAQRLGFGRSLGQVFAALYLSPEPLGLADLTRQLHISKGNASMSVRQLAEWGAVRQVWVRGDRKDYYEVNTDFAGVVRTFLSTLIRPRLESAGRQLRDMREGAGKGGGRLSERGEFMRQRIARLESLQKKAAKLLPLAETFIR